ncbi:MAG TPA: hypothetical protein VEZ40_21015 [Pyrinomonadaceae bacterium]|nr:hypothetical protein [Pyrinomonadaceae bacterium]
MFDMISQRFVLTLAGALFAAVSPAVVAAAQQPKPPAAKPPAEQSAPAPKQTPAPRPAAAPAAKPLWSVKVSKKTPISISLSSKNGSLPEIAAEIGKRLKVPVILTPLMQKQRLTQEFEALPLEGALRLLAPQVYVDYELSGDAGGQPKPIGIYLQGMNEQPPAEAAVVKGDSEAILIEGNTEDGLEATNVRDEDRSPLRVTVEKNQLSVKARKQPLTAVLYEIASKVDIPFEMKYESTELVDVDFNNFTMEQAVRTLSPNIRLYQRTNLTSYEVRPLRLVLVSPGNNQQTTKM